LRNLFEARRVDDRARQMVAEYRREVFGAPGRWETLFDALLDDMRRLTEPLGSAAPSDLREWLRGLGASMPPGK
jgi:hypothetical protein